MNKLMQENSSLHKQLNQFETLKNKQLKMKEKANLDHLNGVTTQHQLEKDNSDKLIHSLQKKIRQIQEKTAMEIKHLKNENMFFKQESEVIKRKLNSDDQILKNQVASLSELVKQLETEKLSEEE